MAEQVFVIGSGRTDFKRNLLKEEKDLKSIIVEAGRAAIADSGLEPGDIKAGIVGNFAAGLFTKQLHLGAMLVEIDPAMRGIPTLHTEAACASGGVGVLTAAQLVAGGIYDAVLVVGAEQQKTMPVAEGADVLGAAGEFKVEKAKYGSPLFPNLFGEIARRYQAAYGLSDRQLASIAVKNYAHARQNPLAQMRAKEQLTVAAASETSQTNPMIAAPLRLTDCSQITDGAAAVVLVSERFMKSKGKTGARLLGYGHATDHLTLDQKEGGKFTYARRAAQHAYSMAGLSPRDMQGAEIHDCFSITEIVAYEALGFAEAGQGAKLAESGATALPAARDLLGAAKPTWSCAVNAGGGLIADGHPVGATGVRQVVDAHRQVMGRAGAMQIDGLRQFITFNMGGTLTTSVAMIWGK